MEPNASAPAASPAPDAGGVPAQPAAPAQSVPPAAPAAPANQPTPAEQAEATDADEWGGAVNEIFPGLRTLKKEGDKNEPTDPKQAGTPPEAPKDGQEGDKPPESGDEGASEGNDENAEEAEAPDTAARDARVAQREYQQQVETVKSDVRSKMFADAPKTLQDADGDPIRDINDVMKLINPRTIGQEDTPEGRPFTEEEAGMWLLSAQQTFNQNVADLEKRVEQIAEVNVDLGEQADVIKYKYGELLKVLPDPENPKKLYRDTLWQEYEKTLVKDPESGTIIQTPMSLETFYNRALAPYARMAAEAEQNNNASNQPEQPPAPDPNANRQQERADRSDIFGGTNPSENMSEDDKEWDGAIKATFTPGQLKNLNK